MTKKPMNPQENLFEQIKQSDENGNEFWMARQLAKVLDYNDFRNFTSVIQKAKEVCNNSGQDVKDHLVETNEEITHGKGAVKNYPSFKLGGEMPENLPVEDSIKKMEKAKTPKLF
jgi:DNA-damage-inducible protein D